MIFVNSKDLTEQKNKAWQRKDYPAKYSPLLRYKCFGALPLVWKDKIQMMKKGSKWSIMVEAFELILHRKFGVNF